MRVPENWNVTQLGNGTVQSQTDGLWLTVPVEFSDYYHDAQISDYDPKIRAFQNRPPLRLTVTVRAEGEILGTAGFGFWNHMFVPGERGFRIPQAIWFFFGSPPNNIALAKGGSRAWLESGDVRCPKLEILWIVAILSHRISPHAKRLDV